MKKFITFLLGALLLMASSLTQAQQAQANQWELIKHIGETSLFIPVDRASQQHQEKPFWRTFRILIHDTDIAPNSIVMTVTLDCEHKSMRTNLFELYDALEGKGNVMQSSLPKTDGFIPMNEDLASAGKAYESFCEIRSQMD